MSERVTTVEELEALPGRSVVMDVVGGVYQRADDGHLLWSPTFGRGELLESSKVLSYFPTSPFTVLFRPDRPVAHTVTREQVGAALEGNMEHDLFVDSATECNCHLAGVATFLAALGFQVVED